MVFADWLEENSNADIKSGRKEKDEAALEWADFIRRQIQFANARPCDAAYWDCWEPGWASDNPDRDCPTAPSTMVPQRFKGDQVIWRRGVPEGLAVSARLFLEEAENIAYSQLPLYRAKLSGFGRHHQAFLELPVLQSFLHMNIGKSGIRDVGAKALAECPYLVNLRGLNVTQSGIGSKGIQALVSSSNLSNLRKLRMQWTRYTREDIETLANSPTMQNLESLTLGGHLAGKSYPGYGEVLAAGASMGNLQKLDMGTARETDSSWLVDVANGALPSLDSLVLGFEPVASSEHFAPLVRSKRFWNLKYLDLGGHSYDPSVWDNFPDFEGTPRLKLLSQTRDRKTVAALSRSAALRA